MYIEYRVEYMVINRDLLNLLAQIKQNRDLLDLPRIYRDHDALPCNRGAIKGLPEASGAINTPWCSVWIAHEAPGAYMRAPGAS